MPTINFTPARYHHYRSGKLYETLVEVRHSETLEELVVYRNVETGELWARPVAMFFARVKNEMGDEVPRFAYVSRANLTPRPPGL